MLLVARDIVKDYAGPSGPVRALAGVSFELEQGGSLAVMGPSGSGKSTLLNILGALDSPTSGEVLLDGVDVHALGPLGSAVLRNTRIGFVFQDHHLLPQCTALENVLVPFLASPPGPGAEQAERARELLALVGLASMADRFPSELSGGERQRVAIARAMARTPGLLLCDEPTGSLDAATAASVARLFLELRDKRGVAVVLATHNEGVARLFGRVRHLREGRLCE